MSGRPRAYDCEIEIKSRHRSDSHSFDYLM
jgi:hypothetical protein